MLADPLSTLFAPQRLPAPGFAPTASLGSQHHMKPILAASSSFVTRLVFALSERRVPRMHTRLEVVAVRNPFQQGVQLYPLGSIQTLKQQVFL